MDKGIWQATVHRVTESDISIATLAFFWFPFATFSISSFSACGVFLHLK